MWRDGFEGILKPKDTKTDRQTGALFPPTTSPCQVASLKDLGQPCPELGSARHPTSPAAPCRPCRLVAWLPPCRSVPLKSLPPPGQLPRKGVTKSGMGPRARVACAKSWRLRTTPNTPFSLLSAPLPGLAPSKLWGTARTARSPARTGSSFISATRPQAQ